MSDEQQLRMTHLQEPWQAQRSEKRKVIQDPIYGTIFVEPFILKLVDTRYFQRLRSLKQLGTCQYLYPSAEHTRFEHSLGVYHLTSKLLDTIEKQVAPTFETDDERGAYHDACRLVKVAGLCHDIGHGPCSHMFEQVLAELEIKITHEEIGEYILQNMLKEHNYTDEEIAVIQNLIKGTGVISTPVFQKYTFLNNIVSNNVSSLDTDKLDYLNRDSYSVKMPIQVNSERIISNCRVFQRNKCYHLAFNQNVQLDISQVFSARYCLHRIIYQHPKSIAAELNFIDALLEAQRLGLVDVHDAIARIKGGKDGWFDGFEILDDSTINAIVFHLRLQGLEKDPKYARLMTIWGRIRRHTLAKNVYRGYIRIKQLKCSPEEFAPGIRKKLDTLKCKVIVRTIDYGKRSENPIDYIPMVSGNKVIVTRKWEDHIKSLEKGMTPVDECGMARLSPQAPFGAPSLRNSAASPRCENSSVYILQPGVAELGIKLVQQQAQTLIQPLVFSELALFVYVDGTQDVCGLSEQVKQSVKQYFRENLQELNIKNKLEIDEFQQFVYE